MRLPVARAESAVRRLPTVAIVAIHRHVWTWLLVTIGVSVRTVQLYFEDHCTTYAAAIAYYAIFSLVPLLLLTVSVLGVILDEQVIIDFIFEQLPIDDTEAMRDEVQAIVSNAQNLSAAGIGIGIIGVLWSASGIFGSLRKGLNRALARQKARPFWSGKLLDIALVPAFGLLVLVLIMGTTVAQIVIDQIEIDFVWFNSVLATKFATLAVTTLVVFVAFVFLYRYVPNPQPGWRQALVSSAFAIVLFDIAYVAPAWLFQYVPVTGSVIYAGFGLVLTLLLWIYINASIVLLGAEFGRAVKLTGTSRDRAMASFLKPFRG